MIAEVSIRKATTSDAQEVSELTEKLLSEIVNITGVKAFNFNLEEALNHLILFMEQNKYHVFVAEKYGKIIGFISLIESYALYAEGSFGTIPELYVSPEYRSEKVGLKLINKAKEFGKVSNWKRLEVTTPALPEFERTLSFYEREGFIVSGGKKLRVLL
jgi:GNAT superfamily N-acetyltransferase